MLERQGFDGRLSVTDDLDAALDGADVVLIQISVGGQTRATPTRRCRWPCGCIGQETTGAGGFAKAMRTVPVVLEIAERARRLAAPGAWIVDFTNPVGIVTRALLDAGHRAVGLCNVAIGVQREVADILGAEPDRIAVDQVGLNHLTWVRAVRLDGRDVLPELLAEHAERLAPHAALPVDLLRELGAIPSYYLRYFYEHDRVLAEQRAGVPRAERVAEIERELLDLYRDPALDSKPALLEQRGGAYYSEAATALVVALQTDSGEVKVVDGRNGGTLAGLAPDDVVEVPARVGRDGPVPLAQEPLAPELLGLVQHVAAYERLTAEAAVSRDPRTARLALLTHPLVGQWRPQRGAARPPRRGRGLGRGAAGPGGCRPVSEPIGIAVDGGNSKTHLALVRRDGEVLALVRGPRSSPQRIGLDGCLDVLGEMLGEAVRDAGLATSDGALAEVGRVLLAGADLPVEEQALQEALSARRWARRMTVANDTFGVLRAGSEAGWGVAVVCGAGVNCVGVAPDGRETASPRSVDHRRLGRGRGRRLGRPGGRGSRGRRARPAHQSQVAIPPHFGSETPGAGRGDPLRRIHADRLLEVAPSC